MSDLKDAHLVADEALRLKAENERLRGLIRAVVEKVGVRDDCPICAAQAAHSFHADDCRWPALVAEAEKP